MDPASPAASPPAATKAAGSAAERTSRKTMARLDRQLVQLAEREAALSIEMATHSDDYERLAALSADAAALSAEREVLETAWLEAAEGLE